MDTDYGYGNEKSKDPFGTKQGVTLFFRDSDKAEFWTYGFKEEEYERQFLQIRANNTLKRN